jgi:rRNA maturation endonuclease Nob1
MNNQSDYKRVTLRLPPALHKLLDESSRLRENSLNTEIIKRLTSSISSDANLDNLSDHDLTKFLAVIAEELREQADRVCEVASKIKC